jgi:hypothetical protein
MFAQAAPPPPAPATQVPAPQPPGTPGAPAPAAAPPVPVDRVFASEAGVIFNAVKADQVKNFEMILERLRQALAASPDPARRQQAAAWKIFKAAEAGPAGSVIYLFVIDPVVKGADYGVAKILAEAFPAEAQELYRVYTNTFASGQTLLNLDAR